MKKILLLLTACTLVACFDTKEEKPVDTDIDLETSRDFDFNELLRQDWAADNIIFQHLDNKSKWYFEPITIGFQKSGIIHSSFDCPSVNNGVIQNAYSPVKLNHSFCTKCMTEELISAWNKWHDENTWKPPTFEL